MRFIPLHLPALAIRCVEHSHIALRFEVDRQKLLHTLRGLLQVLPSGRKIKEFERLQILQIPHKNNLK